MTDQILETERTTKIIDNNDTVKLPKLKADGDNDVSGNLTVNKHSKLKGGLTVYKNKEKLLDPDPTALAMAVTGNSELDGTLTVTKDLRVTGSIIGKDIKSINDTVESLKTGVITANAVATGAATAAAAVAYSTSGHTEKLKILDTKTEDLATGLTSCKNDIKSLATKLDKLVTILNRQMDGIEKEVKG